MSGNAPLRDVILHETVFHWSVQLLLLGVQIATTLKMSDVTTTISSAAVLIIIDVRTTCYTEYVRVECLQSIFSTLLVITFRRKSKKVTPLFHILLQKLYLQILPLPDTSPLNANVSCVAQA